MTGSGPHRATGVAMPPARNTPHWTDIQDHARRIPRITVPPTDPPFHWRDGLAGSPAKGDGAVLRIGTDAGVEGVAVFARPGAAVLLDDLVDRLFRDDQPVRARFVKVVADRPDDGGQPGGQLAISELSVYAGK
jgi:hypothetical protein